MNHIQLAKKLKGAQGTFLLSADFQINKGEILGIMGPSGEGKSSLLRMIAGLMQPDGGRIEIMGKPWFEAAQNLNVSPWKRSIGFVFQTPSLFPHLSLIENLRFALPKNHSEHLLQELLQTTGLQQLTSARPHQLSGGQQQRGALVRALTRQPDLLLLDEPFSALDAAWRSQLQQEVRNLVKRLGTTTLLVSHDAEEIARVADRVLVLENHQANMPKSIGEVFGSQALNDDLVDWQLIRKDEETGEAWWAPKWKLFKGNFDK